MEKYLKTKNKISAYEQFYKKLIDLPFCPSLKDKISGEALRWLLAGNLAIFIDKCMDEDRWQDTKHRVKAVIQTKDVNEISWVIANYIADAIHIKIENGTKYQADYIRHIDEQLQTINEFHAKGNLKNFLLLKKEDFPEWFCTADAKRLSRTTVRK